MSEHESGKKPGSGDSQVGHLLVVHGPNGSIRRGLVAQVRKQLDNLGAARFDRLVVWLHSPGGDAHAAYKLCLELRHRCEHLHAVVSDSAKSAATLMLMGFDRVYMAPSAELGPLDVQLRHPDRDDVVLSGLDVSQALYALGQTGVGIAVRGGGTVIQVTGLQRSVVIKELMEFSSTLLQPVIAKLDPQIIHRAIQDLRIAEHYATRLLARRKNVAPEHQLTEQERKSLADDLVNEYPAHGFVIDRDEAARMRLPIYNLEDELNDPQWMAVHKLVTQAIAARGDAVQAFVIPDVDRDEADVEQLEHDGHAQE